jgi:demethylmenaquinone methyltransferase/2-methoxy-6-polyprenyl-1,4-benzoquinol methylase
MVIKKAAIPPTRSLLLDLGAGTGDLGLEASHWHPTTTPIEADFTLEMMRVGRERRNRQTLRWTAADALWLPFSDHAFDAVVSGFLLRNVVDLQQALREQHRVIKPGGRIVSLDTTHPSKTILTPFVRFYMHTIIPFLGKLVSGQKDAYIYLPDSSESFLSAEELTAQIIAAGFSKVGFKRMNFGTIAIHWGEK